MIIVGVDPGSLVTGYSVLEERANKIKVLEYGVIRCPAKAELQERLGHLLKEFQELLQQYKPQVLVMESIFYAKNVKSALVLAHARGTILACTHAFQVKFFEFAPRHVKQAVAGTGKADKTLVAQMMQQHLSLKKIPEPLDASDALAVAWTYLTHKELHD